MDSAIAQAVGPRLVTIEARVRTHPIPGGFCGGKSGTAAPPPPPPRVLRFPLLVLFQCSVLIFV
jgi:hypothetical protein